MGTRSLTSSRRARCALRVVSIPLLLSLALSRWNLLPDRLGPSLVDPNITSAKSILWVTAHPDDESFFFGPTLANLLPAGGNVAGHLLCLSTGDHEGLGFIRRAELRASCSAFGIPDERCISLDHPELPDDPNLWWSGDVIESLVRTYVDKWSIDLVISFDDYGVSGHANHKAVSAALRQAVRSQKGFPPTFAVLSTNVVLKFTSALTLPTTLLKHALTQARWSIDAGSASSRRSSLILSSPSQYLQARKSFAQHQSQWRWFRTLFVTFSRYLWFAELENVGAYRE